MTYEINISLHGRHLFATDARSLQDIDKLGFVLKILREKFPTSEGYKIIASEWVKQGKDLSKEEIERICSL